MVTPLAEAPPNGKENQPGSNFFAQPSMKSVKSGFMGTKGMIDKKKRGEANQVPNGEGMHEAFDQLLVRQLMSALHNKRLPETFIG